MGKVKRIVRRKGEKKMRLAEKELVRPRPCSPTKSLEQSLKEVQLMKKGVIPEISFSDWYKKIKEDKRNGRL